MTHLSPEDQAFFSKVSTSMFANPFSHRREAQDGEIVGLGHEPAHRPEIMKRLCAMIATRFEALGPRADISQLTGRDGDVALHALLFWAMHDRWNDFDALDARSGEGMEAAPAPFVRDLIKDLMNHGIAHVQALRYVSVFYQIHRAYMAIEQGLKGQAEGMRRIRERLWMNVFTYDLELYFETIWDRLDEFSVFLIGASGTGKGNAAKALGQSGWIDYDEKRGAFALNPQELIVQINLSQYSSTLIESELFGHTKGSFTGAVADHDGVFTRCKPHGTLFLDEIGEVAEHIQVKLLNVLQERLYTPVGTHKAMRFEGRVIAATNRTMEQLQQGGLRRDFFYRLCSDVLEMPSLRERFDQQPQDMELMVQDILAKMLGPASNATFAARVTSILKRDVPPDYAWPGNVRELEQAVRQAVMTGGHTQRWEGARPHATHTGDAFDRMTQRMRAGSMSLEEVSAAYCKALYAQQGSYQAVAKQVNADRRTVKRHVVGEDA